MNSKWITSTIMAAAGGLLLFTLPARASVAGDESESDRRLSEAEAARTFTGRPTAWALSRDGTVSFRLEGERTEQRFRLWFTTPASQTATTRFEELVLDVLLRAPADAEVTVVSDSSNEDSGRRIDDALPIERIEGTR